MAHAISWFEIPVADFSRAQRFYEAILQTSIERTEMGPSILGMFPGGPESVSGAIVHESNSRPSTNGTLVYLNGGDDLAAILGRVGPAGGQVVVPKTEIGNGYGYFAHFLDSEGNKVGLHSMG